MVVIKELLFYLIDFWGKGIGLVLGVTLMKYSGLSYLQDFNKEENSS